MIRFLMTLAARFLIRRLLSPKLQDVLLKSVDRAELLGTPIEKRNFVKRALLDADQQVGPDYLINVVIELTILIKQLQK